MRAELPRREVRRGHLRQVVVCCPLRDNVHGAADDAQRRHAVQHDTGALQDFDTLSHLRIDGRRREHSVEATIRK